MKRACLAHDLTLSLESPSDFELGEVKEKEIQHGHCKRKPGYWKSRI